MSREGINCKQSYESCRETDDPIPETRQRKSIDSRACEVGNVTHVSPFLPLAGDVCDVYHPPSVSRRHALIYRRVEWKVLQMQTLTPIHHDIPPPARSLNKPFSIRREFELPEGAQQLPTPCLTLKPFFNFFFHGETRPTTRGSWKMELRDTIPDHSG